MSIYHLLHFVPDLLMGTRFTIGAAVQIDDRWVWVEAPRLPPAEYLGPRKQLLLEMALDRLRREPGAARPEFAFPEDFDPRAPPAPRMSLLGNHFHASIPQPLPAEEPDPVRWARANCLPRPHQGAGAGVGR
jgi:hypothetical protein